MKNVFDNIKDKTVYINLILAGILVVLHSWQFVKSGHDVRALVNLIMIVIFLVGTFIFGYKGLSYFLAIYSFIWLPFEEFDSLTSLLLLLSAISLNKKLWVWFIPYCISTLVIYMVKGLEISHVGVTACYLYFFWNIYVHIRANHNKQDKLVITETEEQILKELCNGKEVKELELSENTVYKKLREARERNDCLSNDELKTRYRNCNMN